MTSRNLFFRLLKEDFKRRLWSFAISCLVFFLALPIGMGLALSYYYESADDLYRRTRYIDDITGYLSIDNGLISIIIFALAIIIAISGFSYLYSKKKTDFYHSIPVKRELLYSVIVVDGLLIVLVPYVIFSIIAALMAALNLSNKLILLLAFKAIIYRICTFSLLYSFAILGVMLTSNVIISIFGILFFYLYFPVAIYVREGYMGGYYKTYQSIDELNEKAAEYSSPLFYSFSHNNENIVVKLIICLVISIIMFLICMLLHKIRKSEYAGRAMAFDITKAPIKILIVILSGLIGNWVVRSAVNNIAWGMFGATCGVIVSHCVIEIIYNSDFKKIFANVIHLVAALLITFGIVMTFVLDLTGYDTFVPKENNVESMAIFTNYMENEFDKFHTKVDKDLNTELEYENYLTSKMSLKDYDIIKKIALNGIENAKATKVDNSSNLFTGQYYGNGDTEKRVVIRYKLKSGRLVFRQYVVDVDTLENEFAKIYNSPEYKNAIYPILADNAENVVEINYIGMIEDYNNTINLDKDKTEEILKAYQEELLAFSFESKKKENPIGFVRFCSSDLVKNIDNLRQSDKKMGMDTYRDKKDHDIYMDVNYYPIYPSFTKTISLMEKEGFAFLKELDPRDVKEIIQSYTYYSRDQSGNVKQINPPIKDRDRIKTILERAYIVKDNMYINELGGMNSYTSNTCYAIIDTELKNSNVTRKSNGELLVSISKRENADEILMSFKFNVLPKEFYE